MTIKHKGFTLVELIVVIVILAILTVFAAPRFINLSEGASQVKGQAAFASMISTVNMFQAQCLARGGDDNLSDALQTQDPDDIFHIIANIDGPINGDFQINSNWDGSCYPTVTVRGNYYVDDKYRIVNNVDACYVLLKGLLSDSEAISFPSTYVRSEFTAVGTNVSLNSFQSAKDKGYEVFIHQKGGAPRLSVCHYYYIGGDLTESPYLYFNANKSGSGAELGDTYEGLSTASGTIDLTDGVNWETEFAKQ